MFDDLTSHQVFKEPRSFKAVSQCRIVMLQSCGVLNVQPQNCKWKWTFEIHSTIKALFSLCYHRTSFATKHTTNKTDILKILS